MFARFKSHTAEAIRAEIDRLSATEVALYSQLLVRRTALAQVEEGLLDAPGDDVEAIVSQRAKAQAEVEAAAAGVLAAHERRVTLIGEWYKVRGSEMASRAARLRGDLAEHQRRVDKALTQLAAAEGVDAEEFRRGDPVMAWFLQRGPNQPITRTPRSIALQTEIAAAEHEAVILNGTNPELTNSQGNVTARSVGGLIEAMLQDPTRVTPSALAVEQWARAAERQNPHLRPQQPRIYRMSYVADRIVEEGSTVRAIPVTVLEPAA